MPKTNARYCHYKRNVTLSPFIKWLTIGFQKTNDFIFLQCNKLFFEQNLLAHVSSALLTNKFFILNSKGEKTSSSYFELKALLEYLAGAEICHGYSITFLSSIVITASFLGKIV